jgi:hypothetical protein
MLDKINKKEAPAAHCCAIGQIGGAQSNSVIAATMRGVRSSLLAASPDQRTLDNFLLATLASA